MDKKVMAQRQKWLGVSCPRPSQSARGQVARAPVPEVVPVLGVVEVASLAVAAGVAAASAFAAAAVASPQGSACVQQLHQTSNEDMNM